MSYDFEGARPAVYNEQYFDSQTEAAWAAYFDAAGMPFEREPETFSFFDGHLYTPDFYLPEQDSYFEVKNGNADWSACYDIAHLSRSLGKLTVLADGMPRNWAVYFFFSNSERRAGSLEPFPANKYSDLQFYRHQLREAHHISPLTPYSLAIRSAIKESDLAWSTDVDPALRNEALARRRALNRSPRKLYRED